MIENYSKEWIPKYLEESKEIKKHFGKNIIDIQHIGSTSVPNLAAKPIIDIAVLVESIEDIPKYVEMAGLLGYSYKPELSSTERIFLRKGNPVEYHLSVASSHTPFWDRQIKFRDFLISNPEYRDEYARVKIESSTGLNKVDSQDLTLSQEYNSGKTPFIEKLLGIIYKN